MTFQAHLTVRFGDIDHAGIVYYPRFLHYFHVAMEEFFAAAVGLDYARFLDDHGLGLPTVRLEIDFARPLRYGDSIDIGVGIEKLGRTSIRWRYDVSRPGEAEAIARARLVTVNMDLTTFEKREIPGWLRDKLADHLIEPEG